MRILFHSPLVLLSLVVTAFAADGRVSEVHPLGTATPEVAYGLVQGLVSSGGRAVLDEGHNTLIVLDTPERQEAVRKLLQSLQGTLSHVRIESRIVDRESGSSARTSASGQLVVSAPRGGASGSVYFNVRDRGAAKSRRFATRECVRVSPSLTIPDSSPTVSASVPAPCRKRQFFPSRSSGPYPVSVSNAGLTKTMGLSAAMASVTIIALRTFSSPLNTSSVFLPLFTTPA